MKKVFNAKTKAGSQEQNEPRLLGSIVEEMLHGSESDMGGSGSLPLRLSLKYSKLLHQSKM